MIHRSAHLKPIAYSMLTVYREYARRVSGDHMRLFDSHQSEAYAVSSQLHSSHHHDTLVGMGRSLQNFHLYWMISKRAQNNPKVDCTNFHLWMICKHAQNHPNKRAQIKSSKSGSYKSSKFGFFHPLFSSI